MDIVAALATAPWEVVLCGNLDPTEVFVRVPPEEVRRKAAKLLEAANQRANLVLSSGRDLPPNASLANLDAFYQAVNGTA